MVFTVKYFYTTDRDFLSSDYHDEEYDHNEIHANNSNETNEKTNEEENAPHSSLLEAFNYNEPIIDQDPRALKKEINKKLNYADYEDRIRMESPSKLDANGLYVSLMQAVDDNDIQRAKNLIKRGARLNSPDGNTSYAPIFWAISNGNVEMVELLLEKGAKVNTPDEKGLFPIHWVIEHSSNRPQVYQMKAIFDLILDRNPNEINRQDTVLKQTPIMLAVSLDNKKAFSYLLDRGANLTILNENEENISDLCSLNACRTCLYLIETKEKLNKTDPLPNFASTFTAPDPIWLPYSTAKKTNKKKVTRNPNEIVIQGDSISIPIYKDMPDILPLQKEQGPNMVITND
ncbi:MAG: ankyrin repeat domain-containing protein [Elusimicrobiaceae bacterium]|nr:ankyrin repeat domain-containing protein [Elusimicrobiaceae bacterium]